MKLKPNFDEAGEIGVNGTPGYRIDIFQIFGENARGLRAVPNTQTWQKNVQSAQNVYVDGTGQLHYEKPDTEVLADTKPITTGATTPLRITDKLAIATSPNASETVFMVHTMQKKLGLNGPNKNLPTPPKQPWKPNAQQRTILDTMRGPFLEATTNYIFVDKQRITELRAQSKLSEEQLNLIKQAVQGQGLNWDTLPVKYERFSIGDNTWEYRP
jgi:hypothetical protein